MKLSFGVAVPSGDIFQRHLPPVILLHGMMDSKTTWTRFAAKIADATGRKVYYLDARNHGDSPWSEEFNFDILAEDLSDFLTGHSIRKTVLVGHSMGGKTALTLALRKPEMVEKLIIEDMTPRNLPTGGRGGIIGHLLQMMRESLSAIPEGADERNAKLAVSSVLGAFIPTDHLPKSEAGIEQMLGSIPLHKVGNTYQWKTNLDVLEKVLTTRDSLKQDLDGYSYSGDTLFLCGGESFFNVSRDEEIIKKMFPNSEIDCLTEANHLIHHQHPRRFLEKVVHFINKPHMKLTTRGQIGDEKIALAYSVADPSPEWQRNLPPVILWHGMQDSRMTWERLAPRIANATGRKVYYVDARNHGDSPWSWRSNFDVLAEDVARFMDTHRMSKAILIGHSMGGKAALTLALRQPEKVEKLVVEDISPKNLDAETYGMLVSALDFLINAVESLSENLNEIEARRQLFEAVQTLMPPEDRTTDEEEKLQMMRLLPIKRNGTRYAWKTNIHFLRQTFTQQGYYDQSFDSRYMQEAFFIYGTKSHFNVSNDESIPELFPNARLYGVEGGGHMIHGPHEDIFLREVVQFINDDPPTPSTIMSKY